MNNLISNTTTSINNIFSNSIEFHPKLQLQQFIENNPVINNIFNCQLFGFNNLPSGLKIFILLIILAIILYYLNKIIHTSIFYIKQLINNIILKHKNKKEKVFNDIIQKQIYTKLNSINKFMLYCSFIINSNYKKLIILNAFTKLLLKNNTAVTKFENNNILFIFNDFKSSINNILQTIYTIKTVFKQKFPEVDIYISLIELKNDSENKENLQILKNINDLKISKEHLICNSSFKFYYSLIKPQIFSITSNGEYLTNTNTSTELFIISPQIDDSLSS